MAHCINISHPEYISLRDNFKDIKDSKFKAMLSVWQETVSMDRFPTKEEFKEYFKSVIPKEIIKEGVSDLFESNPELADIGTPEQYSQYLDTIFPDYIDNFAYEAVEELLVANKIIDRKC